MSPKRTYRLGDWLVEPNHNRLSRDGESRQLERKTIDVLAYLIEHADGVVSADELLAEIWSGRVVEESTIHRRINQIRHALGDDARSPSYIKTIRKRGYQIVASVSVVAAKDESQDASNTFSSTIGIVHGAEAQATPTQAAKIAIAVSPFRNLTNDPDQEFFSDGIAEDILNELAKTSRELIVRPSASSFALKGESLNAVAIGERLAVTHVLEGSVQRSGKRVRVTLQLSEVAGNRGVWSDRYDSDLTDIFEVQDDITRKVLHALNIQFNRKPNPRYPIGTEAYEAFLHGMHHARAGEYAVADDWYQKSADLDPNNPDLWGEWARLLGWQMFAGLAPSDGSLRRRCDAYLERALVIDPSHWARARKVMWRFVDDRHYQSALNDLAEIVRDHPNSWDSLMYLAQALGAIDPMSSAYDKAARRWSLLSRDYAMEQRMLIDSGRLGEAHQSIERNRGWNANFQAARLAAIERDFQRLEALVTSGGLSRFNRLFFAALSAYLQQDFERARSIVASARQTDRYQPFLKQHYIALIERDLEAAFEFYAKAVEAVEPRSIVEHAGNFLDTVFPEFVSYPPYQRFLADIGLDAESTAKIEIPELPF